MSSPDTAAERAYVAARVAQMDQQLVEQRAAMQAELDLYRDDLAADAAARNRAHQERVQQIRDDQAAWLTRWLDGDPDEGRPTDVDQGQVEASAAGSSPASTPGPGPGQPDPYAAELAEAERIRALPMSSWAQERQSMIRSSNGLFGQQGVTRERL
jgi:hypothetical protein